MAEVQSPRATRVRQTRKSIAHLPALEFSDNKENATLDLSALSSSNSQGKQAGKKARSKSIGPGGLDALKASNGNRSGPASQVRSILKITNPVSPPKAIPPRSASSRASPARESQRQDVSASPRKSPSRSPNRAKSMDSDNLGEDDRPDRIFGQSPRRVAVRTEEEQARAARERERQEMQANKEARRKSLANRRVSFAPEATLHTWNVIEMPEDSTTSSASTNSTRRASGIASTGPAVESPEPFSDASEPPSTPPEQVEELQVAASPAHQRDLHQKKRRRSSTMPQARVSDSHDMCSSPYSGDSADESHMEAFETADEGSDSSDSDDKDMVEEETITNVDADDNTTRSNMDSTGSSARLEAALQQAAKQAGTQGIDYDEHGELTMEMADDEVTNAFQPFVRKGQQAAHSGVSAAALDQENINPFSPAFKEGSNRKSPDGDGTMEMTQAVGGILADSADAAGSPQRRRKKSVAPNNRRRSSVGRRRSSGDASSMAGDETMDLTMAVGGIQQDHTGDRSSFDEDEELTMEFTGVLGGVIPPNTTGTAINIPGQMTDQNKHFRRQSRNVEAGERDMDFTAAVGGILLPAITERTEPLGDHTIDMDMTAAFGAILPGALHPSSTVQAKSIMEREADVGQLSSASAFHDGSPQRPMGAGLLDERPLPAQVRKAASPGKGASPFANKPWTPISSRREISEPPSSSIKARQIPPAAKPTTPSKQATPQASRPLTPGKTPPSKNVAMRTASPKKLFKAEIKSAKSDADNTPQSSGPNPLFRHDPVTGQATPSIVLKPKHRRSSGLGIDRIGLGSPRAIGVLNRRSSIGDSAKLFVPQVQFATGVQFEDPRIMEQEIDHDITTDARSFMQNEADEQEMGDDTFRSSKLKNLIESLTPQKKKLNGRKSLHVGAAKGLLGKRPAELDGDEDSDATPKRLKGREGSPVKNVRLPAPPQKSAITNRLGRTGLAETSGNARSSTPSRGIDPSEQNTTPKDQSRFRDAEAKSPARITPLDEKLDATEQVRMPNETEDRIELQDFLNMTGIRFMELTTTKRRHTVAPQALEQSAKKNGNSAVDGESTTTGDELEDRVVAGACTVPMLELYQHSCRELKNYISEGRRVAKEIEEATYEDNPQLFREYISAPADVRSIMDNQFKNVKTNARLLSKAMWYEWRMKLLDGLTEGLKTVGRGMEEDSRSLTQQQQLLQPVLPQLEDVHDKLESQVQLAQAQADELANCNQEELRETRMELGRLNEELDSKRAMMDDLRNQLRDRENALERTLDRKQKCNEELQDAERVCEDCRGWSNSEVAAVQVQVHDLEASHGWCISSTSASGVTMTYKQTLQLFFTPSAFRSNHAKGQSKSREENASISLNYIADSNETRPQPLTTEKRFFLQIIRAQLHCLEQSQVRPSSLLTFISESWDTATSIASESTLLNAEYITNATITSDENMTVQSIILLRAMRTKVHVNFGIRVLGTGDGSNVHDLKVSVTPTAKVIYGETLNEKKMGEFLETKLKNAAKTAQAGSDTWAAATRELEIRLIARGKK